MEHLSRQFSCQKATVRHIPDIPGWGFVFQLDGALAHRVRDTVAFLERKVPDFISSTLWPPNSPDLNPVDYSICSVLQEKVYRSTITNVSELDVRLINERGRFVQSIVYGAIAVAPSSQRLGLWSGAHFEPQALSFTYFVIYLQKIIKHVEIRQSSDIIFHSFP